MRVNSITILKALAIILVVMAHSCCPTYLSRFSYMICVSLFFMASGYCFNVENLDNEADYIKRRFKRLYVPFVKWSIFLLVLNHLWFYIGFLSEKYGNAAGGVTHPLNLHDGLQSLWSIVFNMSGYDAFLGGAFWFFRTMLVASIVFFVMFKLLSGIRQLHSQTLTFVPVGIVLAILALFLAYWQQSDNLRWTGLAQGGYRELMAVFFMAAGYTYRQYEVWLTKGDINFLLIDVSKAERRLAKAAIQGINYTIRGTEATMRWLGHTPLAALTISGITLALLTALPHPSMTPKAPNAAQIGWLALSGVAGFCFMHNIARILDKIALIRTPLIYIGANTLYIFGWHLLAFKVVSMLKVGVYHLPWEMVGGHPVVHAGQGQWFWIIYTIIGIALPLGGIETYRYLDSHYNLNHYLHWCKVGVKACWKATCFASKKLWTGFCLTIHYLWVAIHWCCVGLWQSIYSFCQSFVDTIREGVIDEDAEDEEEDDNSKEHDANHNNPDNSNPASTHTTNMSGKKSEDKHSNDDDNRQLTFDLDI